MEEEEEKNETVVFYPSPGMGHLISMVELGKRFLQLNAPFSIIILITETPYNTGSTAPYIRTVQSTHPSIIFHHLPPISLPPNSSTSRHFESTMFRLLRLNNPLVHHSLLSISLSSTVLAVVYDAFCSPVLDVAAQLHLPAYCFFTSQASVLAVFLHIPTLHRLSDRSFQDLGDTHFLHVPGVPPIPATHMPVPMLDRSDEAYDGFLATGSELQRASGILVNSFDSLEPRTMSAVADGACVPDGRTPPVYCIGPLVAEEKGEGGKECLEWLDEQPSRSVVFLCFGSMGTFSAAQLREIAVGLERSGQRFLWVVRSPPTEDESRRFERPPEPDLDALLPEGFLERTEGRGMVVKQWAPQAAVLGRPAVGGFVTHCGWNSVLEAICAGVPMVAWPLYAEQRINKEVLVVELELAMALEGAEKGWVGAEEVERKVRGLMESEEGESMRKRTAAMKEKALAAIRDGGSSHSNMAHLVQLWKKRS